MFAVQVAPQLMPPVTRSPSVPPPALLTVSADVGMKRGAVTVVSADRLKVQVGLVCTCRVGPPRERRAASGVR
jgi:hypothetical protein